MNVRDYEDLKERLNEIDQDTRYRICEFLPKINEYLSIFVETNFIPDLETEANNEFINQIVSFALNCVTDTPLNHENKKIFKVFLKTCIDFGVKAIKECIESYSKLITQLLLSYSQYTVFQDDAGIELHQELVRYFISKDYLKTLFDYFHDGINEYSLSTLFNLIASVDGFYDNQRLTILINSTIASVSKFVEGLSKENLRKINHQQLEEVFKTMATYISRDPSKYSKYLNSFFMFLLSCFKTEILDVQLFGVRGLSAFLVKDSATVDMVTSFCANNRVAFMFLSKDHHTEVVKSIKPIFKYLARMELISHQQLNSIWNNIKTVHPSEREPYIVLLGTVLKYKEKDSFNAFIEEKVNTLEDSKLKSEVYASLIKCLFKRHTDFASFTFQQLWNQSLSRDQNDVKESEGKIMEIAQNKHCLMKRTFMPIIQQAINEKTLFNKFFSELLTTIVDSFERSDEEKISQYVIDGVRREELAQNLLSFYYQFLAKNNVTLTQKEVSALYENAHNSPEFWKFALNVLELSKKDFLTKEVVDCFVQIFNEQNPTKITNEFALFLIKFIDYNAFASDLIETTFVAFLPKYVLYRAEKIPLLDFVYKFVLQGDMKNEEVQNTLINFLCFTLTNNTKVPQVESTKELIKIATTEVRPTGLNLLYKFIQYKESSFLLSDFGIERHIEDKSEYREVTLTKGEDEAKIHIRKNIKCSELMDIVGYVIDMDQKEPIIKANSRQLDFFDVVPENENNFTIDEKETKKQIATIDSLPTKILSEMNFQTKLIEQFIGVDECSELAIKLLNLLPDDPIIEMFGGNISSLFSNIINAKNSKAFLYFTSFLSGLSEEQQKKITPDMKRALIDKMLNPTIERNDAVEVINFITLTIVPEISRGLTTALIHSLKENTKSVNYIVASLQLIAKITNIQADESEICASFEELLAVFKQSASNEKVTGAFLGIFMNIKNEKLMERIIVFCLENIGIIADLKQMSETFFVKAFSAIKVQGFTMDIIKRISTILNLFISQSNNQRIVCNTCSILKSIIKSENKPEAVVFCEIIQLLANILLKVSREEDQRVILDFFVSIYELKGGDELANDIILTICATEVEDFGTKKKDQIEMCGLVNLGATCYMNSVLQQLFYTFPLMNIVLDGKGTNPDFLELKNLFAKMYLRTEEYTTTKDFVDMFSNATSERFTSCRQEDAVEFFHEILEHIPFEARNIFRGESISYVDDMDGNHISQRKEEFTTLDLVVRDKKSMEESLQELNEVIMLTGKNKYKDDLNRLIDAKKYSKLSSLPPVLVVHLNRFDYDMTTFERIKLNSQFEFPFDEMHLEGEDYYLRGIVMHTGSAEFGHYFSHVKINNEWYTFNDTKVTKTTAEEIQKDAFGGKSYSPNAYLLFYENKKVTKYGSYPLKFDFSNDLIFKGESEVKTKIEDTKQKVLTQKIILGKPLLECLLKVNNITTLLVYYFNIFTRSTFSDSAAQITDHIISVIDEQNATIDVANFLIQENNILYVATVFQKCNDRVILDEYIRFINHLINSLSPALGAEFLGNIFDSIDKLDSFPIEKANNLINILLSFCSTEENISLVAQNDVIGTSLGKYLATFAASTTFFSSYDMHPLLNAYYYSATAQSAMMLFDTLKEHQNLLTNNSEQNTKDILELLVRFSFYGFPQKQVIDEFIETIPSNTEIKDKFNLIYNELNSESQ